MTRLLGLGMDAHNRATPCSIRSCPTWVSIGVVLIVECLSSAWMSTRSAPALSRRAKLGISCRVQVPAGQGLATHPYRVLGPRRSRRKVANKAG